MDHDHETAPRIEECLAAAAAGDIALVLGFLEGGVDLNASTPAARIAAGGGARYRLLEVVLLNDLELARTRLEEGADPNSGTWSYYEPVLKLAAELGYLAMVDLLLDHGADIEATDDAGQRPLLSAAFYGQTEVVRRLLDRGAALDAVGWSGQSALANAAIRDQHQTVELLHGEMSRFSGCCLIEVRPTRSNGMTDTLCSPRRQGEGMSRRLVCSSTAVRTSTTWAGMA